MGAGRPPKPTALKKLEGTDRSDRVLENEMMPSRLEYPPEAPSILSERAKIEWDSVVSELLSLDMLHRVDIPLLSAYCIEMDSYYEAVEIVAIDGSVTELIRPDGSIYRQQNPWVGIKNTCLKNAQSIAKEFGFTPSARTKITAPLKEEEDTFEAAMKMA